MKILFNGNLIREISVTILLAFTVSRERRDILNIFFSAGKIKVTFKIVTLLNFDYPISFHKSIISFRVTVILCCFPPFLRHFYCILHEITASGVASTITTFIK